MPCESGPSYPTTVEQLNDVTDKLCWIMTTMTDTSWVRDDIKVWWLQHQADDRKRKAQAAERAEAERKRDEQELDRLKKKLGKK